MKTDTPNNYLDCQDFSAALAKSVINALSAHIAILNVSGATVSFHRKNLRSKLGLKNRRTNLRTYLLSIS